MTCASPRIALKLADVFNQFAPEIDLVLMGCDHAEMGGRDAYENIVKTAQRRSRDFLFRLQRTRNSAPNFSKATALISSQAVSPRRIADARCASACTRKSRRNLFAGQLFFDHAAVEKLDRAFGVAGETRIVRHHANRRAFAMQFAQAVT